jgi:hypothetical protein
MVSIGRLPEKERRRARRQKHFLKDNKNKRKYFGKNFRTEDEEMDGRGGAD